MTPSLAAAILAGGSSKRMGRDKALLVIENQYLIDRIYSELSKVISQIRIIGKIRPSSIISPDCFVSDHIEGIGPMSGLVTALNIFSDPVLVVPCDMPNIRAEHIRMLISKFEPGIEALVSRGLKGLEPLFALYLPECRAVLESVIEEGDYALYKFVNRLNAKIADFTDFDKNSDLFFNINTLSDYKKALYLKKNMQK